MEFVVGEISDHESQDNICLLCSKNCNNPTDCCDSDSTDLKQVLHYLNINIDSVGKQNAKSVLFLCQKCRSVINKLSSLFKELEATQMWINHVLRNLMKIIISGEDNSPPPLTEEEAEESYSTVVLRELIMEKCTSTLNSTPFLQLNLNLCQSPQNIQEKPYLDEDDPLPSKPSSPPPPQLHPLVKQEETDVTFQQTNETLPPSPSPPPPKILQPPPTPSPGQPAQLVIFNVIQKKLTSQKPKSQHNPFWFVKPTKQISPAGTGQKRAHYFCTFCPKSFNGSNCIKFHSINNHPENIFASHNFTNLTNDQFRACCSAVLEEEVIPISNEDDEGTFTTFQCKYCPPTAKTASHPDKRIIQKHLLMDHYDLLVRQLLNLQLLQGTREFEERVAKHLGNLSNRRKVKSNQFKRKWKCDGCDRGFPNVKRLEWHMKTCERLGVGGGGKIMKGYKRHESGNSAPKPSPCDTCGKVLSSGYSLWKHKRLRCLKGLREKSGNLKVRVERVEREVEEEILPDVNDKDPFMSE